MHPSSNDIKLVLALSVLSSSFCTTTVNSFSLMLRDDRARRGNNDDRNTTEFVSSSRSKSVNWERITTSATTFSTHSFLLLDMTSSCFRDCHIDTWNHYSIKNMFNRKRTLVVFWRDNTSDKNNDNAIVLTAKFTTATRTSPFRRYLVELCYYWRRAFLPVGPWLDEMAEMADCRGRPSSLFTCTRSTVLVQVQVRCTYRAQVQYSTSTLYKYYKCTSTTIREVIRVQISGVCG